MIALPWPANPKDTSLTPSYSHGVMARVSGFICRTRISGDTCGALERFPEKNNSQSFFSKNLYSIEK